jgi:hypothetical protein
MLWLRSVEFCKYNFPMETSKRVWLISIIYAYQIPGLAILLIHLFFYDNMLKNMHFSFINAPRKSLDCWFYKQ